MARGVIAGGLFFGVFACFAFILASALPLWWYTTTELEGDMCACGTGLWRANFTWGDDLTQPDLLGGPYICSSESPRMTKGCDAPYTLQSETRSKGHAAGALSILATIASFSTLFCAFLAIAERRDLQNFRRNVLCSILSCLTAISFEVATIVVFMGTPLFDNLGYNFQCHFIFDHALNSNPLRCQALGPSFGLAIGGCILSCFSCAMFVLAYRNPHYIDPNTGRYSMFEHTLLGARPLDPPVRPEYADCDSQCQPILAPYECQNGDDRDDHLEQHLLQSVGSSNRLDNPSHHATALDAPLSGSAALSSLQDQPETPLLLGSSNTMAHENQNKKPMCGMQSLPLSCGDFIRLFYIPTLLILNAALFTWSNCSTGATVEPDISITFPKEFRWLGHKIFPHQMDESGVVAFKDDVFNFTIFTSLRHFWSGHAYGLAILIGAFSGCWPYIKLFTMMCLWFIPAREKLRGKFLHWLDVLGKWSLVDAYVLCLMAVAFGFDADKSIAGIRVKVKMSVRPGWGVYSFVIATMISLCLSHFMTHLHRHAMESREFSPALLKSMARPPREQLSNRSYAPFPRRRRFTCSNIGQFITWFVLLGTLSNTLAGQLIRTFEFRFSGIADLILAPEKRNTTYSLVTNGLLLPEACSQGGFLSGGNWAWFMTIMYFAFAMVIPLMMLVTLAILWGVPMTLQSTKRLFHFCQILQAWSALDVFIVSIVAAVLEIGSLSEAIIASSFSEQQAGLCKFFKEIPKWMLDPILRSLGLPSIDAELEHCALFRVDAVLLEGTWLLISGIVAWALCTQLIMEFADASIVERTRILEVLSGEDEVDSDLLDPYEVFRVQSGSIWGAPESALGDDQDMLPPDNNLDQQLLENHEPSDDLPLPPSVAQEGRDRVLRHHVQSMDSCIPVEAVNSSVYLRKILQAQEEGARRYVGSFGDGMYGPFPRSWWPFFNRLGVLDKVAWDKVGFDIHAALLMNVFAQRDEGARSAHARGQWIPASPYTAASPAAQEAELASPEPTSLHRSSASQ
mmetsp:Transcript_8136/g.16187  ORF Transcript_8136/g.16187 Transcript_8136/m.16187 type:complete len:1023 (-) Transcript_8136:131-3199(-)|eukprot:CAMPEP_0171502454 /NCGR_PEP_ID=MMETSP0958-20121227/10187_1 /TAXON_ID=87120 /ORGANISM="Aurantiochytrium limacinum, Strain ATCCMYA-1381" /LENGTH=1022 /DNA_ID=CAMNT_0012037511 /DNA_START=1051 /DNA_END=4119 /DNA_ORIENTATION=-